jgi:hypothetical protein
VNVGVIVRAPFGPAARLYWFASVGFVSRLKKTRMAPWPDDLTASNGIVRLDQLNGRFSNVGLRVMTL